MISEYPRPGEVPTGGVQVSVRVIQALENVGSRSQSSCLRQRQLASAWSPMAATAFFTSTAEPTREWFSS
jgi:hypothetical protein